MSARGDARDAGDRGWRDVLVAIDVGTSGARAAAFDLDGRRRLEVRRSYPTSTPRRGWAEQDPRQWRQATLAALAALVGELGTRRRVHAIGLTGQCPSVMLVDARGRPIGPALIYRDNRATAEAAALRSRFGEEWLHRLTGHRAAAFHILPKLLWLRAHAPAEWREARLALQPRDWIALTLSGEAVTDGSHAAATLAFDLRRRRWDAGILDQLDLTESLFPRVDASSAVIGTLRPQVAQRVGLATTTPIVLGGADSQACALGAGVIASGPVSEMAGSSTCLNEAVAEPLDVLEVTHYPHVIGEGYTTETGINTSGAAIDWVAELFFGGRRGRARPADFTRLDREAAAARAGADGVIFVPALADGERVDPDLRAAFVGLSLRNDRSTLARAALEGVALTIRAQLMLLAQGGAPATELRISGGDTRLATWNQIKADVTGLPVTTVPGDAAVTGVAMLTGLGIASTFTGLAAYSSNLLLAPDAEVRAAAQAWYEKAIRFTAGIGARITGGHVGAFTVHDWTDIATRAERWSDLKQSLAALAAIASESGLEALVVENLASAREPSTMAMVADLLTNGGEGRVPIRACIDVGHMCVPGTQGEERDPYAWLRHLGAHAPIVQLQQSDAAGDHHWPFTPAHDLDGRINPDRVLAALVESGARRIDLILEVIPPFEQADDEVLEDLVVSVDRWRDALVRGGFAA